MSEAIETREFAEKYGVTQTCGSLNFTLSFSKGFWDNKSSYTR